MRYRYYTADVFTDRLFGGNPLAVFPDAEGINPALMQVIARELNLSETVFVLPSGSVECTRRLRIFTPAAEMPFAGHPTVGTAYLLAAIGAVEMTGDRTDIVFEEGVGPVPVTIGSKDGRPVSATLSAARMPEVGPPPPATDELAAMLSLEPGDILDGEFRPEAVSCGIPFLFIPIRDRAALGRVNLDTARWKSLLADYWATQVFLFSRDPELAGSDIRARMFAPALGLLEDPATGSAAAALAGYLGTRDTTTDGTLRWVMEQGFEMGRPSILEVEADKQGGRIVAIRVGGSAVMVAECWMEIP